MVNWIKKSIFIILLLVIQNSYAAPITVLLDWYINPNHAPILVAINQGYFKKHGLDIELVEPSDSTDQAKMIAIKKADIAITYQPHYRQQLKQGLPIQQVGTLIPTPLDCLVYLPSSGIHTPQDLKGKRVGYSDASDELLLLKAVLTSAGLTLSDITLINVHYSLMQALMMGKIDLAVGMMRNVEPVIMRQQHFSPQMFYPEDFGIATYSELIYITPSGKISTETNAFLEAVEEATLYLQHNPKTAWDEIIQTYPQLNTTTNHALWKTTAPLFSSHPKLINKATL